MNIREVRTRKDQEAFLRFPFTLYRNDPLWVPLLTRDMRHMLWGRGSFFSRSGPHAFYLVSVGKDVAGRIAVGVDTRRNELQRKREGYVTLFECVDNDAIAQALFAAAEAWLRAQGMESVVGPISPTNGDDFRGLLVENFTDPPFILTSYNPPYYERLFLNAGFTRHHTFLAFRYDLTKMSFTESLQAIEYAKEKYGFDVRPMDHRLKREELEAIQRILESALLSLEYDYLTPPTLSEILETAKTLRKFVPPGFAQIAWGKEGPIGFAAAMPDYNEILRRMRGRVFPTGWLALLRYRRRITRGRAFLLFVIPAYQGKGVPRALLLELFREGQKRGYTLAEGSLINAANVKMCREAEALGGIPYKKFALFWKRIQ